MMYILIHLGKKDKNFQRLNSQQPEKKMYGTPTLRLVPLVFFMVVVVVTTGIGVVFWLSSYFRNSSEMAKSRAEC